MNQSHTHLHRESEREREKKREGERGRRGESTPISLKDLLPGTGGRREGYLEVIRRGIS